MSDKMLKLAEEVGAWGCLLAAVSIIVTCFVLAAANS